MGPEGPSKDFGLGLNELGAPQGSEPGVGGMRRERGVCPGLAQFLLAPGKAVGNGGREQGDHLQTSGTPTVTVQLRGVEHTRI